MTPVRRCTCLAAATLVAASALSGCRYFSSGDYPPVERVVQDTLRVFGNDSLRALGSEAYELYGPTSSAVEAAKRELDYAVHEFTRYMGTLPPQIAVVLFDTPAQLDSFDVTPLRSRGLRVLRVLRPADLQEEVRRRSPNEEPWPISNAAARVMLFAYADMKRPAADSSAVGGSALIPAWFAEAIASLATLPRFGMANGAAYVRSRAPAQIPLAELFTMGHPLAVKPEAGAPPPDEWLTDWGRGVVVTERRPLRPDGERASDRGFLFSAESQSLAQFMSERERPEFLGFVADRLIAGATMDSILVQSKNLPHDVAALERAWRGWLRGESY